jgi:hypothetical protein
MYINYYAFSVLFSGDQRSPSSDRIILLHKVPAQAHTCTLYTYGMYIWSRITSGKGPS